MGNKMEKAFHPCNPEPSLAELAMRKRARDLQFSVWFGPRMKKK